VRYAEQFNVNGLPKHWCQELIATLDAYVTKYGNDAVKAEDKTKPLF